MNERALVPVCLVLSLFGGAAAALVLAPSGGTRAEAAAGSQALPAPDASGLEARLDALAERLDGLAMEVASLADARRAPAGIAPGGPEPDAVAAAAPDATAAAPEVPAPTEALTDLVARLVDGSLDDDERWELLDRLREEGRLDEVLERLLAEAEARPNDPEAHYAVGLTYVMQIQEVGASFKAGPLAAKADAAFDRTLAIDEDHLDARRSKAVSLSFWPAIMGKRPAAIEQFEILIEKQQQHPPQQGFDESYVLLGNLYLESGNAAKAEEVFRKGLELHPDSAALAAQVQGLSSGD